MKAFGIILIVLGLGGAGVGGYGMMEITTQSDIIDAKKEILRTNFPTLEEAADLDSIEDLVAIDRLTKDDYMLEDDVRSAAWDILNAMGDREDAERMQLFGFSGGGGLFVVGLILLVLGGRKKD